MVSQQRHERTEHAEHSGAINPVELLGPGPGGVLSVEQVVAVARGGAGVTLAHPARKAIAESRQRLEAMLNDGLPHYGVNTGFGSFSRKRIGPGDLRDLQRNLIRSHASGVGGTGRGDRLSDDVVRAMMLLLAASLSRGVSGVRPLVVETIVACLNAPGGGVVPVVPPVGSCGASGDLAPLAHVTLALIGEGRVTFQGRELDAADALRSAGIEPVALEAKEGLALINGTHLMAARGALLVHDSARLFEAAIVACAMSIDAAKATHAFLDPRVFEARNQPGPARIASDLRGALLGSQIATSHAENDPRVQDPYSFRCAPHVLGAASDALTYVRSAVERELGAVTDNPLVLGTTTDPEIVSAGNFHGMPIAIPLDALALPLAHIAGISERRVAHLVSAGAGQDPEAGLPAFLVPRGGEGLHSGYMIAQYAAAACCNEIVGLCTPASVVNFTTSANMEDYNSWGPRSAAKAERILRLARSVVAIELLCAAQGIDEHRPLRSGAAVERAHERVRRMVPPLTADRPPAPDIESIERLIASEGL